MSPHFHPDRGADAFLFGCPCCGDELKEYGPETEDDYEHWAFRCGCELVLAGEFLTVNQECPEAMSLVMESITYHDPEPHP